MNPQILGAGVKVGQSRMLETGHVREQGALHGQSYYELTTLCFCSNELMDLKDLPES